MLKLAVTFCKNREDRSRCTRNLDSPWRLPAGTPEEENRRTVGSTTDWLVPVSPDDDVSSVHPCAEQPCLHRMLAECPADQIVRLANLVGLLLMATGKVRRADALPPEPVDVWRREIRALRNATALWDAVVGNDVKGLRRLLTQHQAAKGKELFRLAREHLARRVTEKMAGGQFKLAPPDKGLSQFVIRYQPCSSSMPSGSGSQKRSPAPSRAPSARLRSAPVVSEERSDRTFCSIPARCGC